jgi:hypothetical protein
MQLAPKSQNIKSGYDINATKRKSPGGRNVFLTLGSDNIGLWVYEIQTAFALGGSTAQSYRTRTFFARNFVQPKLTIMTQAPNQEEYGRVVEFIHKSQHEALNNKTTKLQVVKGGIPNVAPAMKGVRRSIQALGYITTIKRRHERFLPAPEYSFEFVVSRTLVPQNWADDPVAIRQLKSWQEVFEGLDTEGFVENPDTPRTPVSNEDIGIPPNLADIIKDVVGSVGS